MFENILSALFGKNNRSGIIDLEVEVDQDLYINWYLLNKQK